MPNVPEDATTSPLAPGFLVGAGRYSLIKQIGEGGMGSIWLAQDERLNEKVALKFLSAAFRNDLMALANLRTETQKSRKLTHPNIVRIHDLYESPDELPFISMEYVDGMDLWHLKGEQPQCIFPWEFLKPIVKQLCDALDYAHREDVIHRDLKPSNMILDSKGRLKLADFGLAAQTYDPYASARPDGYWGGGTANYMSPQQLHGYAAGIEDDIYALGATLYELLTSKPPFYVGDIAEQVANIPATPITDRLEEFELKNDIPRDVRAMIMACLSKEPEKRPQSAQAVAEWIGLTAAAPAVNASVAPVAQNEVTHTAAEPVAESTEVQAPPVIAPTSQRNVRRLVIAGGIAALVIIVLVTWLKVGSSERSKHEPVQPFRTIDTSFDPGTGANVEVRALAVQKDGKVIVGGRFTLFNDERHVGFVRLNKDGSIDRQSTVQTDGAVWSLSVQPDEKILIGGDFSNVNGEKHPTIARLDADLAVDPSFNNNIRKQSSIRAILQTKDKIIIAGPAMVSQGTRFDRISQLDTNGNPTGVVGRVNGNVWALAMQPNGQILVGGEFSRVEGGGRHLHLIRLNADGTLDAQFAPNPNDRVYALALQPDGKIVVGGAFERISGTQMRGIARLNPDGSIDESFNPGSGANSSVQSVAVQSDGKILIGGTFRSVDGSKRDYIARLNSDGTVNQSFAPQGLTTVVRSIAVTPDDDIYIGGGFTNVDGVDRHGIARLKSKP